MIKFIGLAFVRGQLFTQGMIAEFDTLTEEQLKADGDAVTYVVEASGTIENAVYAQTAGSATTAVTAQNAVTAQSATTATTASTAVTANSASFATTAATATNATSALNADHADTADTASTAAHATTATSATSADSATNAQVSDKTVAVLVDGGSTILVPKLGKPVEVISVSAVPKSCASTSVNEVLDTFSIPAGTLGVNSVIQIEPLWSFTNSANSKILKVRIGGIEVYNVTRTTSVKEAPLIVLANRNSLSSQIQVLDSNYIIGGANLPATYTIDFSKSITVDITGQRASGADTLKLEYFRALHFAGD